MKNIDVSVVIVNYNTLQMTNDCITSLTKFTSNNLIEIIVIDNASTDGSKAFFTNDKRIKYIYSEENLGFGRANNVGIELSSGKYIFMLNSDTILLDDIIAKLFNFAEANQNNLGAVGTCLINNEKKDALSFGLFLTPKRIYRRLLENIGVYKNTFEAEIYSRIETKGYAEVDFISGADLFVPKSVFDRIKGFDSDFFMYYEETDLQKRMDGAGLKRYSINQRDIIHLEGGSFGGDLPFKRKMLMTKGMKLYINKHFSSLSKIHIMLLCLLMLFKDLIKLDYSKQQKTTIIKEFLK